MKEKEKKKKKKYQPERFPVTLKMLKQGKPQWVLLGIGADFLFPGVVCGKCGKAIESREAKYCKKCGGEIDWSPPIKKMACPSCNKTFSSDDVYCDEDGTKLIPEKS